MREWRPPVQPPSTAPAPTDPGRLRVATFNVNGIRASRRRGFTEWLAARECDVIALQEVRCPADALPGDAFGALHLTYDPGSRAGRNGVGVLTRVPPAGVRTWGAPVLSRAADGATRWREAAPDVLARGLRRFADEGRYVEVDLADRPITVASLYLPKGGLPAHLQKPGRMREAPDGGARYARKMAFLDAFARHLDHSRRRARRAGRDFLLLGDLNIAPEPADVTRWRASRQMEGFLPEEREWFAAVTGPRRLVDVVRRLRPDEIGPMSWWSWLGQTFENDVGWRIDHHLATPALARAAVSASVDRAATRPERMSDHAPVVVEYAVDHTDHL